MVTPVTVSSGLMSTLAACGVLVGEERSTRVGMVGVKLDAAADASRPPKMLPPRKKSYRPLLSGYPAIIFGKQ